MSMSITDAAASDNKGTAYWQALDNAHHLHPYRLAPPCTRQPRHRPRRGSILGQGAAA